MRGTYTLVQVSFLSLSLGACGAGGGTDGGGGAVGTGATPGTGALGGLGGTGGVDPGTGGAAPTGPCVPGTAYAAPAALGAPAVVYQGTGNGLFEGPVWVASAGALYFSDMTFSSAIPPSVIHRFVPPATGTPFISPSGSNGLALDVSGMIVGCTHEPQGLTLFDPNSGGSQILLDSYNGAHFNSPNDLTVRADGNIYFTDPDWQLGGRVNETGMTGVYRRAPTGEVALVDGTLDKPNGIALSPDGGVLYVADYNGGGANGRVGWYGVNADGSTGARADFALGITGPDGMTVDCGGNVYVASHDLGMIRIYAPTGAELAQIQVAASLTNLAFGGADGTTLYATAGKALYAIQMSLPGYPF